MEYQLLATDMDGTLLNEKKKISAENHSKKKFQTGSKLRN